MIRLFALAALSCALTAHSAAAPLPEGAAPVLYFPVTVGDRNDYLVDGKDRFYTVVTKVARVRGGVLRVFQEKGAEGTERVHHDVTDVSPSGLVHETVLRPPITALRVPVGDGRLWERHVTDPQHWQLAWSAARKEVVVTPAGRFAAVRVDTTWRRERNGRFAGEGTYTRWFAPGVGEVKLQQDATVRELTAFSPRKR